MFRDTYARGNQGYLFPDMAPAPPPQDAPLYAILMHDADPGDQSRLAVADVIFPDPEGQVVGRIHLVDRFPHLFVTEESDHVEMVEGEIEIELYPEVENREKSG
jgi:hypothetical protein